MLSKPTPVRLSEDVDTRLGELAKHNGVTKAHLIRLCVDRFLDEIERSGGVDVTHRITIDRDDPVPKTA